MIPPDKDEAAPHSKVSGYLPVAGPVVALIVMLIIAATTGVVMMMM